MVQISIWNILMIVVISYVPFVLAGYILGKRHILDFQLFKTVRKYLADPITLKLRDLLHRNFFDNIKQKRGMRIFTVIFINNLFLGALIARTLYGIVFFVPYLLTIWGGLGRGVVCSKIGIGLMLNPIGLFEFPAYLFASAVGIRFGLDIINCLIARSIQPLTGTIHAFILIYPIVIALVFTGALLETRFLVQFPVPEDTLLNKETIDKNMDDLFRNN